MANKNKVAGEVAINLSAVVQQPSKFSSNFACKFDAILTGDVVGKFADEVVVVKCEISFGPAAAFWYCRTRVRWEL